MALPVPVHYYHHHHQVRVELSLAGFLVNVEGYRATVDPFELKGEVQDWRALVRCTHTAIPEMRCDVWPVALSPHQSTRVPAPLPCLTRPPSLPAY